ncbi:uncharacterized protein ISCGN_000733 [Ixodes scapularis]
MELLLFLYFFSDTSFNMKWSTPSSDVLRILQAYLTFVMWSHIEGALQMRPLGIMPSHLALDSSCKSSLECLLFIANSHCSWHRGAVCDCQPYHVRYNNSMCLKARRSPSGGRVKNQWSGDGDGGGGRDYIGPGATVTAWFWRACSCMVQC